MIARIKKSGKIVNVNLIKHNYVFLYSDGVNTYGLDELEEINNYDQLKYDCAKNIFLCLLSQRDKIVIIKDNDIDYEEWINDILEESFKLAGKFLEKL